MTPNESEGSRVAEIDAEEYDGIVERLLEQPYHVIDFLPVQVPADSQGQYFAVEEYFRKDAQRERLYRKFADVLVGLNCYYGLAVTDGTHWQRNMPPEELYAKIAGCSGSEFLNILVEAEESLITLYGGDLYMTVYRASAELLETLERLVSGQGLFVREGQDSL